MKPRRPTIGQALRPLPRRGPTYSLQVGIHHDPNQVAEGHRRLPPEASLGLGGIGRQERDLGWAAVAWVLGDVVASVGVDVVESLVDVGVRGVMLDGRHLYAVKRDEE
ncbi:protein of unknown function [Candidatus Methylomirabilis oxygeniifera]|uniref:Uncharacterized protein n=1 Tax=Methylomirabilis oxygeniifera TaxID=671143 RepID=D5MMC2_METO1|nr:protein of unknown function [Candidatus Methylomirabilis oxyfera]